MENKRGKLSQLSDLIVETSVDLEKVMAMSNELSFFFEASDRNVALYEFDRRKVEQFILSDYLFKINKSIELALQIIEELHERQGVHAA